MKTTALLTLFLLAFCTLHAQPELSGGRLEIRSDVDSALVILDDSLAGRTPYVADSLCPGVYRVRVLHPDIASWRAAVVSDTVRIAAGKSSTLLFSLRPNLRKAGFADFRTDPRDTVEGIPGVRLIPPGYAFPPEISPFKGETGGAGSRTTRMYLSAGATITSGIFAAYFKTLADDRQAQYVETGDGSFLTQRRRFDTSAAIALVVAQAAFALFCYILLGD
jgi:hypothetical protein